jgi:subtilisin-like proprotein convertase family protein
MRSRIPKSWSPLFSSVMFVLLGACAQEASAQTLTADYQFQNTRSSSVAGAPALTDLGANAFATETVNGVPRTVLVFAQNNGLSLSPTTGVMPNDRYTIVMLFRFQTVSGFRRLIDFRNAASDEGAYVENGHLKHGDRSDTIRANTYVQIVYTRNGTIASQRGYVDGRQVLVGAPGGYDLALVGSTLRFFRDDNEFPNEASAGAVARIRIYDGELSASQVAALDTVPGAGGDAITACSSSSVAVPDNGTADSTIQIDEDMVVRSVKVRLFIAHPNASDLTVTLRSPRGTLLTLLSHATGEGADLGTTCTPQPDYVVGNAPAGTVVSSPPAGSVRGADTWLGYLNGENVRGTWTLQVIDDVTGNAGTLNCWCLEIGGTRYGDGVVVEHVSGDETFSPIVIRATVSLNGAPAPNVNVAFQVNGPGGSINSGPIATNGAGQATYTFTRFEPGANSVFAETDGKSARLAFETETPSGIPNLNVLCSFKQAAGGADDLVTLGYRFRDEVLSRTPRGREYAKQYYALTGEAAAIMLSNPALLGRASAALMRYRPLIEALVDGREVTLGQTEIDDIDSLLESFEVEASPELREGIERARRDLRDPSVLAEFGLGLVSASRSASSSVDRPAVGTLPLVFESNLGQTDSEVRFLARGASSLFLTQSEMVLGPVGQSALRMRLVGANQSPSITGVGELPGRVSTFTGADPARWRRGVPAYSKVKYSGVYPGVDLLFYGTDRRLEYDFVVAPGADPRAIAMDFTGADALEIDAGGDLVVRVGGSAVRQHRPVIYQEAGSVRRYVAGSYATRGARTVGFELGPYDPSRPLIIDPVIDYAAYIGGTGNERGTAIAVDAVGNTYVTGFTNSANFPAVGSLQPNPGGGADAFVMKLSPQGSVVYAAYLGGHGQETGSGIAVDAAGNAYVTGNTDSTDFPVANALQGTNQGLMSAFVAKLNPAGSALVYSTYLGGSAIDSGTGIALDTAGNAYVAGVSLSTDFPSVAPFQPAPGGEADAFVAKLNPAGSALVYSTWLGGSENDGATAIAVDATGRAIVTGGTASTDFPTRNALQAQSRGGFDAFVTKLDAAGSALVYSSYLGGGGDDGAHRVELDSAGNVYLTGETSSTNFPTSSPIQPANGGLVDAFVAKVDAAGSRLVYSTYLGGRDVDRATGLAVDASGAAYLTGFTRSADFPSVAATQRTARGKRDGFVTKVAASGSALSYSTFMGGFGDDEGFDVAIEPSGKVVVLGHTTSSDIPANGAARSTPVGAWDLFLAKFAGSGPSIAGAAFSGKKLIVSGEGYDTGAVILVNGTALVTKNDRRMPTAALIGKKAARLISEGQTVTLRVRNASGALSNEFRFTR